MEPADISRISVILPSYNPPEKIIEVISSVMKQGFSDVIVIDDGSGEASRPIFDEAEKIEGCTVLRHEVNKGKGAAIKTGFGYFLENRPSAIGAVTADDDGQHLPEDIKRCAEAMAESGALVLGVRDFGGPDVPARSLIGNKLTIFALKLVTGFKFTDTQTGLRAAPAGYIKALREIRGSRFEYETNMLICSRREGIRIAEVPIKTVYEDAGRPSHFRTLADSIKIIRQILKYSLGSIISCGMDILGFYVLMRLFLNSLNYGQWSAIFFSTVIARAVSATFNFIFNKNIVFKYKGEHIRKPVMKYCALCVFSLALSSQAVALISQIPAINTPLSVTGVKIFVDAGIFALNYAVQRKWIYR